MTLPGNDTNLCLIPVVQGESERMSHFLTVVLFEV